MASAGSAPGRAGYSLARKSHQHLIKKQLDIFFLLTINFVSRESEVNALITLGTIPTEIKPKLSSLFNSIHLTVIPVTILTHNVQGVAWLRQFFSPMQVSDRHKK